MTEVVTLPAETEGAGRPAEPLTHARRAARGLARGLAIGAGAVLMSGGLVLALLPGHLGVPLVAVGLILVLRNSRRARRNFIHLQRRHPRFVFPVRRLIRREPEVVPVVWQQVLRFERLVLPPNWRRAGAWRRRYFRSRQVEL